MNCQVKILNGGDNNPKKKDVARAVVVFIDKYKIANNILPTESLTHDQVEEVVGGVRSFIYQHEELRPKKS